MSWQLPPIEIAATAVTLGCSLLSVVGSGFILVCYSILPLQHHFRHILIINLAIADFLNSLNGSVGGIIILATRKHLEAGRACLFNGFVSQVTVQGTDTSILVIAIATVYTLTGRGAVSSVPEQRWRYGQIFLICVSVWALPFFTGFLALGMGRYAPASGNWCWIDAKPVYLRYVLTHGWRYLFIITEICLYIFLHFWLRQHYRSLMKLQRTSLTAPVAITIEPNASMAAPGEKSAVSHIEFARPTSTSQEMSSLNSPATTYAQGSQYNLPAPAPTTFPPSAKSFNTIGNVTGLRGSKSSRTLSSNPQYQAIQRVLLLNAYPLAYIILWIPGIANRLIEATGHSSSVMQILQASTQLVGLANALTYGWNERVAKQLKERFSKNR
ncbi:G protein-coupled glucose receptor regulating Gpa2-domain-containing protein [Amanita rubescens]|nr:G protein-coupled glucose receptor regulating Gpa2-domain-containing protein [Amanita rubescens]KAF8338449.1 G protein-coupled glucose receptor regulating Gpa2-domain-containing protein [Amanita rubescens]